MSDLGIGAALRAAREEQGRTIEEAARDTRVRSDYLRALEAEEFGVLGGDVYAKGFLSTYARFLGLDPAPLVDLYRRHVAVEDELTTQLASAPTARQPKGPPPTWIAWVAAAVVVLIGGVALAQAVGNRAPATASAPEDVNTAPPAPAEPSPTPTEGEQPPAEPSPSPSPTFDGANVLLAFEQRSWVRVTVDGQQVQEGIVEAGEALNFTGEEAVQVRFGNAGGVRVRLNGEDLGVAGPRGQVRTVVYTPDGAEEA
ncbi:MAG: helix-turn-helix domain-containing protein [Actinomycetes bacterium]